MEARWGNYMIEENFQTNGFFIYRDEIPENILSKFESEVASLFLTYAKENETVNDVAIRLDKEDKENLFLIYQYIPKLTSFSEFRSFFLAYAQEYLPDGLIYDIGSGVLFGLPDDKRLVWSWHQEVFYHAEIESIVHIWIPMFRDASKQNGAMSALVGTHNLGPLPYTISKPFENGGTSFIPKQIEDYEAKYPEHHFEIARKGFAVFDKNLIHKSNTNSSLFTRFTCVFRIASLKKLPTKTDFTNVNDKS